jgi:hypothetical protein
MRLIPSNVAGFNVSRNISRTYKMVNIVNNLNVTFLDPYVYHQIKMHCIICIKKQSGSNIYQNKIFWAKTLLSCSFLQHEQLRHNNFRGNQRPKVSMRNCFLFSLFVFLPSIFIVLLSSNDQDYFTWIWSKCRQYEYFYFRFSHSFRLGTQL